MVTGCSGNKMHMACHNAPCMKFHFFMFNAILQAFDKNFFILISYEKVNPVYHSKAYKIHLIIVIEFILPAHESKIQKLNVNTNMAMALPVPFTGSTQHAKPTPHTCARVRLAI